jgi:ATP/maltotriose-dependent transcriptional regulator MalT
MTWAARLIEQHFDAVYYLRGEAATIQRWLSALPDDLIWSRPRLLAQVLVAAISGRVPDVGRAVRGNHPAAGQDLAQVVEHDHAVAQQAPPLLRVKDDSAGGAAVRAVSRRARGPVWTHCAPPVWAADVPGLAGPGRLGAGPA